MTAMEDVPARCDQDAARSCVVADVIASAPDSPMVSWFGVGALLFVQFRSTTIVGRRRMSSRCSFVKPDRVPQLIRSQEK